jgi:glucose/arabinose dehydrogenase
LALALGAVVAASGLLSPAFAQRGLKDIPDPDPKAEQATFELGAGLEVNLFAAEPMVVKPIQMNWDARGRLWVVGSEMYPQIKPGEKPSDKVYVLEDTDGDGRADKSTVFAEGLLIPTAVIPGDGGAYVANSTELLHLSDTDGDGRADKTRVVLSGFGTEDTHHILHTMRWGPDGCLYFNQSIYIHSHIETPHGVRRLRGGGTWRFRPETMELEVYTRGMVNGWGHAFDRWGQSFMTDGAYGEGINYAFPGAAYYTAVDVQRTIRGLNPGQPKHCGLEILSGRHLPPEMSGHLVTNDFRGNRINRFALTESGSGYVSRQQDDILRSRSVAFRPVDLKMGPDGALYVADWYNPIIQHGEVDFRDERRDHEHGRIWRITAKGRPLVKPPKIAGAPVEQLVGALEEPEDWTRNQARRQLQERSVKEVLPMLSDWRSRLDATANASEHDLLEALWVRQSFRVPDEPLLRRLSSSKDHRVRSAVVRVLSDWRAEIKDADGLLAKAADDQHAQVRL